jgi:hypothetical protein
MAGPDERDVSSVGEGGALVPVGYGKRIARRPTGAVSAAAMAPLPRMSREILRGDIDVSASMETLQIGYLHAVASAARCSLANPRPDRRLDWVLHHQSESHTADNEMDLKIALKATAQVAVDPSKSTFPFRIENDHLRYLNRVDPAVHKILVVMTLPKSVDDWIMAEHDFLTIRHCCYWVNLAGVQPTGRDKSTVPIPTSRLFDDEALCDIMQRIGRGGKP